MLWQSYSKYRATHVVYGIIFNHQFEVTGMQQSAKNINPNFKSQNDKPRYTFKLQKETS